MICGSRGYPGGVSMVLNRGGSRHYNKGGGGGGRGVYF